MFSLSIKGTSMFVFLYPSDFYPVFPSKNVPRDPAVSVCLAACPPLTSTFSAGGQISATQVRGSAVWDRMPLRAFAICIAVCRKEGLFLFQPRAVLISSSFISYQETEANRLHHFCFYFSLSSALAYTFCHLFPLSEQCHSLGRSCCLSSCYFDQYSVFAPQLLIFSTLLALKLLKMLQGSQLGVRKVIEAVRSVRKQEIQVVLWGFSTARLLPVGSLILPSFTQVTNCSL